MQSIQKLLREIAEHLQSPTKTDKSAAVAKLRRLAEVATTMAFTLDSGRR